MARGGSAKIGALHVSLGLDSAQFNTGLNKAEGGLNKFGKTAGIALAAVATAAATAGIALGVAMKGAIDNADAMRKLAQSIGLPVEELTRLKHAAELSGVGVDGLGNGLRKLSQNMLQVAQGAGAEAKRSFDALGISVTNSDGVLKSSSEVMSEVADKFSRMEDGSVKTALAMGVFGRAGAALIPMLNAGANGIQAMKDEADALGIVIDEKTGRAAEAFNDNLDRLNKVFSGVVVQVTANMLPAFEKLSQVFLDAAKNGDQMKELADNLTGALKMVVSVASEVAATIAAITTELSGLGDMAGKFMDFDFAGGWQAYQAKVAAGQKILEDNARFRRMLFAPVDPVGAMPDFSELATFGKGGGGAGGAGDDSTVPFIPDLKATAAAAKEAKEAIDPFYARMQELSDVLTQTHDPFTQMQLDLADLRTMWEEGRIGVEQYEHAVRQTQLNTAAATLGMVSQLSNAFAGLFKDNKAFAIANAVINTAEGVTKALAQGGLFGYIGAAAVAASGAAQIATIMSTNPGSGAKSASVSAPSVSGASTAGAGPAHHVNSTLQGRDGYSRDQIRDLLEQIGDVMGDGARIRVNAA
jgi:predicted DNA-binding ArsR family transcriptional regulator